LPINTHRKDQKLSTKTAKSTSVSAELARRQKSRDAAHARAKDARAKHEAFEDETRALRSRVVGGGPPGQDIDAEIVKARLASPNPHDQDLQAAVAEFHRLDEQLQAWKLQHVEDRFAESDTDAGAAEQGIRDAFAGLAAACGAYHAVAERRRAIIADTPLISRGKHPSLGYDGRIDDWHRLAVEAQDTEILHPGLTQYAQARLAEHRG
jgi:hypothetical protein